MSKSWKCAICGTTMISKCPSSRSVFMSPRESIINSLLTVNKIDSFSSTTAELFLSFTGMKEQTTGQMFKDMIALVSEDESFLNNLGCDHIWVLNSTTETDCTIDHKHKNLNDIPEILARKESKPERDMKDMLLEYGSVINIAVEQARKYVNISKTSFDTPVEEDFQYLKDTVRHNLGRIAQGKRLKKAFRTRIPGATWRDESSYVYFDTREEATKYCLGCKMMNPGVSIEMDKLNDDNTRYEAIEFEFEIPCTICGKHKNEDIVLQSNGRVAHISCIRTEKQDSLSRKRMGTVKLGFIDTELIDHRQRCSLEEYCRSTYELDDAYTMRTGKGTTLRIFKVCTKPELHDIIQAIEEKYSKLPTKAKRSYSDPAESCVCEP